LAARTERSFSAKSDYSIALSQPEGECGRLNRLVAFHAMSIAVSAVVQPSRLLSLMIGGLVVVSLASGVVIGIGEATELSITASFFLCIFSPFLVFVGFCHGIRQRKPIHIDISGAGQLRVAEVFFESCAKQKRPQVKDNGETVRLLKTSTIWPHLLLLLLQTESGKISVLPILPDSVSPDTFRALSVACRWIAQHENPPNCENF
jgi:toxin CptA